MDGLAKNPKSSCAHASTFSVTLGATNSDNSAVDSIHRNANITITMDSPRVSYSFSVRSPCSPAYDGVALYHLCTTISKLGCAADPNLATYHYRPLMNSTTEDFGSFINPEKENIFYFDYPYSQYVLSKDKDPSSGPCTYSQCYVSRNGFAVKMKYVDGLIFGDKEIRVFDGP
jgi:hypothetical protein